jgi:hypothetical protein
VDWPFFNRLERFSDALDALNRAQELGLGDRETWEKKSQALRGLGSNPEADEAEVKARETNAG